ncbi:MAG TPA: NADH-quinone oxidoreductase subunit N [Actinomycetota bacterium]|nr:NADH-quinone oxidoreductase subunit N [Actinomycetota bacterium]
MGEFSAPTVRLAGIAPEIALVVTAFVVLLVDAFAGPRRNRWYLPTLATLGLAASAYLAVDAWDLNQLQLGEMVAADNFANFVKVVLAAFGLLTVWLARDYLVRDALEDAEFYGLVLLSLAGMMLMAGAADLIVIFLALETFSIALYVLVGFRRASLASHESAMKYFLLGSFSSAFFLLGIAVAYGAVGSTALYGDPTPGGAPGILEFTQTTPAADATLLVIAVGLLVVGLGFKVAAVPFHMWTPDAYQGAPSPVTGFMAAGSKIAAFAALLRLLDVTLFSLRWDWRPLVIGLAVLTMIVGSVLAVVQEDLKRMLAYSSIAHAGFVFTGVIAANDDGVSGALFYLATYGVTVLGAFAVVAVLGGRDERRVRLADYRGLFYDHPALTAALTLFLLSLAGVPVTAGFVGKLLVFGAAVDAGYSWVVVVGAVASAIAAFFYLRVMVVMYMQEREGEDARVPVGRLASGVVALAALATLFFGLVWGPLIDVAERATLFAGS